MLQTLEIYDDESIREQLMELKLELSHLENEVAVAALPPANVVRARNIDPRIGVTHLLLKLRALMDLVRRTPAGRRADRLEIRLPGEKR